MANFDLMKQCPQMYIYIAAWVIDTIHSAKFGRKGDVIRSIISAIISVLILMYIGYCSWTTYKWVTYVHITLVVLVALIKIFFLMYPELLTEEKETVVVVLPEEL